ncbi:hypothetical protein PL8927_690094 [Planktothrix serta PCC 8927]|uniref:Uncharacterized protein n=1 Tax=Planktothrix serta PCC 8927 TaxID=671068 RepID=A0A7Z9BQX8_9CYAN|nr:hypothetical protein PL8927_690094 [Planktothrix serta PCC 8927]
MFITVVGQRFCIPPLNDTDYVELKIT